MSGEIKHSAMEAAKKFRATVIGLSDSGTEKFAQALQEYADSVVADTVTQISQLTKQVEMDTVRFKEMQATGDKLEVELAQEIKHNAILRRQLEDTKDELDTILQVAEAAGYNNSEKIVSHFLFWMELKEDLNLDLD